MTIDSIFFLSCGPDCYESDYVVGHGARRAIIVGEVEGKVFQIESPAALGIEVLVLRIYWRNMMRTLSCTGERTS